MSLQIKVQIQLKLSRDDLDFLRLCCNRFINGGYELDDGYQKAVYSCACELEQKFMYNRHSKTRNYTRTFKYHNLYLMADLVQAIEFEVAEAWAMAVQTDMVTRLDKHLR